MLSDPFSPPLKTAPIFGGIAGVINSGEVDGDDSGNLPFVSKVTKDISEIQDMYRKTLTASLSSHVNELPADQCIEDIFAGGDGWGKPNDNMAFLAPPSNDGSKDDGDSETENSPGQRHYRKGSQQFGRRGHAKQKSYGRSDFKDGSSRPDATDAKSGSSETPGQSSSSDDRHDRPRRMNEVNDLDLREDLRSWRITPRP